MLRVIFTTATILAACSIPALAGTAPVKAKTTPGDLASLCDSMGPKGESFKQGTSVGCLNIETGAALVCTAGGQCTDYFADPRYKKIRTILDGARNQQSPVPL